jgi:hypothetical protein
MCSDNTYGGDRNKPIPQDTVLTINSTGHIINNWGKVGIQTVVCRDAPNTDFVGYPADQITGESLIICMVPVLLTVVIYKARGLLANFDAYRYL